MPEPLKRRPDWIRNTGLISVGFWEPLYFLKYIGASHARLEQYEWMHSDESLDRLAAAGVNLVWTHFFKGFGLEFEKEELARTRDYIQRAHERGLRVATYCTLGSLTPETLLQEEPDAQNWFQVNQDGMHPTCQTTHQCFRVRPCYNSEGYRRYMERVCEHAVACGADMIHFDNIGYNAEPDTCHCPVCVAAFREFLREQYGPQNEQTRARGQARFGHNNFTHVRPPVYNRWNQAIHMRRANVAHQQEWIRFKVASLTECLARISRFIAKQNPECAVEANIFKAHGENTAWLHGIEYDAQLPHLDYAFSEEPHRPGTVNKHGSTITRARTFKTARAFDIALQTYHHGATPALHEISLAETMAFNAKGMGHFSSPMAGYWGRGNDDLAERDPIWKLNKRYLDFYRAHKEALLLNTQSLATVAVYRDNLSLAFNGVETHRSVLNAEQALIEQNVPFDLVFERHLDDLSKYRAVVLANVECLSDANAAKLRRYVQSGGGLLLTEQTGACDEWRHERTRSALADLFSEHFDPTQPVRASFGAGRAAYLPKLAHVEEPSTKPEVWYVFNEYWAAPKNIGELLDALRFAHGGEFPLTLKYLDGRPVSELLRTPGGVTALHIVNMDPKHAARGLEVSAHCDQRPAEILPQGPTWDYQAIPFEYDEQSRRVRFTFGELVRYAVFRIS